MDLSELPLKQNAANFLGTEGLKENETNKITRKIEFDKGLPLSFDFETNDVKTLDYRIEKFLLFFMKKIFASFLNNLIILLVLFFLIMKLFYPKQCSLMNISITFYVHLVLIFFELLFDLFNFFQIYKNDKNTNSQKCQIYDGEHKTFIEATWSEIRVGHIIKVNKNEIVPADMIVLETLDSSHSCYVDVSALTGVFDSFIIKKACTDTQIPTMKSIKFNEFIKSIKGMLKYEEPNSNINSFNGRLKLESFPRASDVTEENFVMRGSTIKDVKCVYGMVVYAGMETKIMQILKTDKAKKYIVKEGRDILKTTWSYIQTLIIIFYLLLIIILSFSLIHKTYLSTIDHSNYSKDFKGEYSFSWIEEFFLSILNNSLIFHFLFPLCLFSLTILAFIIFSQFLKWDVSINSKSGFKMDIINYKCLPEFGKVKYILADKTGTLTSRKFNLKACSILGKVYSFDPVEKDDENFIFRLQNFDFSDLDLYKDSKKNTMMSLYIKTFFEHILLCNSGKMRSKSFSSKKDEKVFSSFISEENAVINMMKNFNYHIETIKNDKRVLKIQNENKVFFTVGYNRYSERRKRMSIILKNYPNDPESLLICKGYDPSIFKLLKSQDQAKELTNQSNGNRDDSTINEASDNINNIITQLKNFSDLGYRYTIYCKKRLNEDETLSFMTKYKSAENYVLNREAHFEDLANEFETEMEFMGVLFYEEKSTDELRYTLNKLKSADINVWVVSGDRRENVLSVARSLDMIRKDSITVEFSERDDLDDLDIKMNMNLLQLLGTGGNMMKMKTRQGVSINVEANTFNMGKSNKKLTIFIHGNCFGLIHSDPRLFQCFVTLLTFTTDLFAYSFKPYHKFLLCQTVKKYIIKNSKVLSIGDGLNDFMMHKEADLSVGIRSKEILQVKNTCDIIVTNFSQIADLILIHGTWNLKRIYSICFYSIYSNVVIIFPFFLYMNPRKESHHEIVISYSKLTFDITIINLVIIFVFCFDRFLDRAYIQLNPYVFQINFMNRKTLIYSFLKYTAKGIIDALIVYFGFSYLDQPINIYGENIDAELFQYLILHTCYFVVLVKLFSVKLNEINTVLISLFILAFSLIVVIIITNQEIFISLIQLFSYLPIILGSILIISSTYLYERLLNVLNNSSNPKINFKINNLLSNILNSSTLFSNYEKLISMLFKINSNFKIGVNKISFENVLKKLFIFHNNSLDPVLENMTDVNNNKIVSLKISKPFLKFIDAKYESDYFNHFSENLVTSYLIYLILMILFWLLETVIEGVNERINEQKISKPIKILSIFGGFILFFNSFKRDFLKMFSVYYFIHITLEIFSIYIEKSNNDVKLCFQILIFFSFPLFLANRYFKIAIYGAIYYFVAILPSVFLNDFGYGLTIENYLYSNLPLLYHRIIFIFVTLLVMIIYGYYEELNSRLSFLKYLKRTSEYKKDWEIYSNLVPEFVRHKMKDGLRGAAAIDYEYVTMLFCDIQDFDGLVANMSAKDMIYQLDRIYNTFDQLCSLHGLQKIETVGKTYLAAGGLKETEKDLDPNILFKHHAVRSFEMAMDMLDNIQKMTLENGETLKLKIGLHTGKVIAAVVGNHKPQFSLIGDTINTTARMCAYSMEMAINCSESTYEHIKHNYNNCIISQKEVKGKGTMNLHLYTPFKKEELLKTQKRVSIRNNKFIFASSSYSKSPMIPIIKQPSLKQDQNTSNIFLIENSLMSEDSGNDMTSKQRRRLTGLSKSMTKFPGAANPPSSQETKVNINKGSFLLIKFSSSHTKDLYDKITQIKYANCKSRASKLHYLYVFTMLIGLYNFSDNFTSLKYISYVFILLKAFLLSSLVIITTYIPKLQLENTKLLRLSIFLIFLLISFTLNVELNYLENYYSVNIFLEQNITILVVTFSGILTYRQTSGNLLLHLMIFIGNLIVNRNNSLLVKYFLLEMFICIHIFTFSFRREFNSTLEYMQNKEESDKLKNIEKLLFNLMPQHVVQNLKEDIPVADVLYNVTLLFADIVKFTDYSSQREPFEVVNMLSELFRDFDDACERFNIYKVHTIGDCYVVMSFTGKVPLNERNHAEEAKNIISMGETMIETIKEVRKKVNFEELNMRIGIHTGTVIAGIIGTKVVRYDIFGSDVLIANKMESGGESGKICVSEDTKKLLESAVLKNSSAIKYNYVFNKSISVSSVKRDIKSYFIDSHYEKIDSE